MEQGMKPGTGQGGEPGTGPLSGVLTGMDVGSAPRTGRRALAQRSGLAPVTSARMTSAPITSARMTSAPDRRPTADAVGVQLPQMLSAIDTPLGQVLVLTSGEDASAVVRGMWFSDQPNAPRPGEGGSGIPLVSVDEHPVVRRVASQLERYFRGELREFSLPLDPRGTVLQQAVWEQVASIGFGETRTYGAIAAAIGRPTASRAVGRAVGANPICVVIGCHRVLGAGGKLTGYAGGLERKRWLLAHEGTLPGAIRG